MPENAKTVMELAVWELGRKKATCTNAIKLLKQTGLSEDPIIKAAIERLEKEKEELKKKCAFD